MSTNNKWGALSMRDRAFLIREAVRNGITDIGSIRDTWEHRFDGNSDTINGGEIPAVTITPEKWQKEFDEFSKKNPEIRESIDENWVLPDRRRRSKEMELQFDRDFLEGNMDYDEYKKHYSRQKNRSNRFPVYYDTSSDHIYKRVLDVYKAAGEPRIHIGEGRPYYRKRAIGKHSIHNISTINDFIEELAHPIEGTGIITYLKDLPKILRGELTRSYEHYEDPNHFEYKTHKIVEPSLRKYILEGEPTPYIHQFSGEESIIQRALDIYNPWSSESMVAKASSPVVEEGLFDINTAKKAVIENDEKARKDLQQANKTALKASMNGAAMSAGYVNPYGIIGDLGVTTISTLADTAIEGNTENLGKDLGTNLAFDLAGGVLQWLPKAIKGGKQVVKNIKSLNEDFIVRPTVPKVKAMYDHSPKWYNFPNEYEFHFATAVPKKYMGELFYAPALEKATTKTAKVNKTSLFDMIKGHKIPQYETTHIQLDGKTLDDILNEPASLYISSSPTAIGGYDGIKGSNVDLSHPSLPSHTSLVHEKKHAVQRSTNAGKADVTQYALGDYRLFPIHEALKSGYHKILADQADFLKELDTGLPPESKEAITELVFQTEGSRNLRELNATMTESLYKMFKNRLPSVDKRLMTKEILDLYKTELAQMTSEEFLKEFSKDANAYAEDYVRGIKNIAKKDPGRAEYLTKRLKDLVINQYF